MCLSHVSGKLDFGLEPSGVEPRKSRLTAFPVQKFDLEGNVWLVGNGGLGYNYNDYYYHSFGLRAFRAQGFLQTLAGHRPFPQLGLLTSSLYNAGI